MPNHEFQSKAIRSPMFRDLCSKYYEQNLINSKGRTDTRITVFFVKMGIDTVGDAYRFFNSLQPDPDKEILKYPGFGKIMLVRLKTIFADFGFIIHSESARAASPES